MANLVGCDGNELTPTILVFGSDLEVRRIHFDVCVVDVTSTRVEMHPRLGQGEAPVIIWPLLITEHPDVGVRVAFIELDSVATDTIQLKHVDRRIAVILALCLGVMTTVSLFQRSARPGMNGAPGYQITKHSATIEGETATVSIFESTDPEMTFLWLEPNESTNGG